MSLIVVVLEESRLVMGAVCPRAKAIFKFALRKKLTTCQHRLRMRALAGDE
jgi:hypothetical protein